jgi:hypothetical protein
MKILEVAEEEEEVEVEVVGDSYEDKEPMILTTQKSKRL